MSLVTCDDCSVFIDSDEDPDCFCIDDRPYIQNENIVLCEGCRENRITQYENLRKEPNDATI